MADPTVVVLIVVASGAAAPLHGATVGAGVREALGGDARVLVEERPSAPSDLETRTLAPRLNASAVAELRWADGERSRAHLRVYVAADESFYDRELSFAAADAAEDRERALGLVVGAMVRAATGEDEPTPAARTEAAPPEPSGEAPRSDPVPAPSSRRWISVDAAATSALTIAGEGSAAGGALGAQLYVTPWIALRASGAARFGSIAAADATTTTLRIGAGPSLRLIGSEERDRFTLHVGVEAVALQHAVSRTSPSAREQRWIGGAYATVAAGWRLTATLEPYAGVGSEIAFGTTPVVVDGETHATIPPIRLTTDLGVRARF